jgi:hypothetical protein
LEPQFKIKDLVKIDKDVIKGSNCINKGKNEILGYLKKLDKQYITKYKHKGLLCNDLMMLFIRNDKPNERIMLNIEENIINEI